jgi:uncharacterized membrane protein
MEWLLHEGSRYVALAIQAIAILVVAIGSAKAVIDGFRVTLAPHAGNAEMRAVWLDYARMLVAGLTFQLAADIVGTSFAPTWDEVGRLAAVAAIRTFLSYFLDREMENARRVQQLRAAPDMRAGSPLPGD